jgi:RNA polymerase sigma factor (sigma-70 family)
MRRTEARTYYKGQEVPSVRLSKQQETELFNALKAKPDDARVLEKIVTSYMAFALRQARRDMGLRSYEARQKVGLNEDDAISAANLGLMQAVRRFNPANGARFTTYAGWWIKKYLAEARYDVHLIRVGCSDRKLYSRFAKMIRAGLRVEEIADLTGHAVEEVERVIQIAKGRQDSFDEWSRHHGDEEPTESPFNSKAQDNATVEGDTPEELAKKELLEKLEEAKINMGKDELSYVYDHFSRGMSVTEMARVRGKSTTEVKAKLAKILSTLRVLLQA